MERLAPDDWRRRSPAFREPQLSRTLALLDRLRPIAERHGCGLPELAVAWTLAVPEVTGAIVGARRPSQVDEWIGAADVELTAGDLEEIERALEETGAGTTEARQPPGVSLERVAEVSGRRA